MSGEGGTGPGDDLTRLTVNLTASATSALEQAAHLTGDTRTDVVNRALLIYRDLAVAAGREGIIRTDIRDWDDRPLYLLSWRQPFVRAKRKWFPW